VGPNGVDIPIAVYLTFTAHALQQHPDVRRRLESGADGYAEMFAQEGRRFYPFFPSTIALTRRRFDWNGYRFPRSRRVMLDLYGTNHDSRFWDDPERFRPERFRDWDGGQFAFIPQGGGEPHLTHRCPGELITIELMKVGVDVLTKRIVYEVPEQDLRIDFSRLPALPRSRFAIRAVRESFASRHVSGPA